MKRGRRNEVTYRLLRDVDLDLLVLLDVVEVELRDEREAV